MSTDQGYRGKQADIKQKLRKQFQEGNYTAENPMVVVDPFELSPLTALVLFRTPTPSRVVIKVKGKDYFTTFTQEFAQFNTVHQIPVHGLYAGCENEVELRVISEDEHQTRTPLKLTTKPLPDDIQKIKVRSSDKEKMAPGLTYTIGNANHPIYRFPISKEKDLKPTYTAAFDANGEIRWFISDKHIGGIGGFCKLKNGNIATGSEKDEGRIYFKHSCYELTHLGEIKHEYFAESLHHHIEEMPNGNLLLLARQPGSHTEEDFIVEVDREKETIVRTWDLKEVYPVLHATQNYSESQGGGKDTENWLHANTVRYVSEDNCFVISGRNQDLIFKFDIDTKEIKWIFTEPGDDIPAEYKDKLLKPKDGVHIYHHGQHYVTFPPNNGLMVYNNTVFMNKFRPDTDQERAEKYSHAVHYRIDEDAMTFERVWTSDADIGRVSWCPVMGSAEYLGQSHYYVNYSSINYDANGVHQRDYFLNCDNTKGNLIILKAPIQNSRFVEYLNDKPVFDAEYDGNFGQTYRSHRWELYWNNSEADVIENL